MCGHSRPSWRHEKTPDLVEQGLPEWFVYERLRKGVVSSALTRPQVSEYSRGDLLEPRSDETALPQPLHLTLPLPWLPWLA